jgi:hypothetical protein
MLLARKLLFHIGIGLAVVGSFLPWEQGDDFTPYWLTGIQFHPVFIDNGGLFVIGLCIALLIMVYRAPAFIKQPRQWFLMVAFALVVISTYHIGDILFRRFELHNVFWAPIVDYGLISVALGSLFLISVGLFNQAPLDHKLW